MLLTENDVDRLLDNYYEGLTSSEEESLLQAWFSRKDVPARFEAEKAMFGYFASQKRKPANTFNVLRFTAWSSVAAAVLAFFLITGNAFANKADNYVFIQGKKYNNLDLAREEAHSSLALLQNEEDEVSKSSSLLTDGDRVIQEQLNLLAGIEW